MVCNAYKLKKVECQGNVLLVVAQSEPHFAASVVYQDLAGTCDYYNVTIKAHSIQVITNVLRSCDTDYLITMLHNQIT